MRTYGSKHCSARMSCYIELLKQHNLTLDVLTSFVKAIGRGDRNLVEQLLGPTSSLDKNQKRALLRIHFNYNHFIDKNGMAMTTAVRLAKKLERKELVEYLSEQQTKLGSVVSQIGLFHQENAEPQLKKLDVKKSFHK